MENLKYPVGKFISAPSYSQSDLNGFIATLKEFPYKLKAITEDITDSQLATPYRPDGWTAQQVIHHLADSHTNMLIRLKWTLTEENPTIKAYYEDRWALLADYNLPFQESVDMIKIIHAKIVALLEASADEQLDRTYFHPESKKTFSLKTVMALYAWHCNHHLAHIQISKGS